MEKLKHQNKEERQQWEIDHCVNPKSKEDFEFLFYSLESKFWHFEIQLWQKQVQIGSLLKWIPTRTFRNFFLRVWFVTVTKNGLVLQTEWCHEELAIINAMKQGAERKAALCRLLDHQTQMLASIDYYKKIAVQENSKKAAHHFLHKVAYNHP